MAASTSPRQRGELALKRLRIEADKRRAAERLKAAVEVFDSGLSLELKRQLTLDIVGTRAIELRRAYRGVRSVCAGFRMRDGNLQQEPCVVFTVDAKRPGLKHGARDRIPKHLLTHVEIDGERRLCAVPTDVDERARLAGFVVQNAPPGVEVDSDDGRATIDGALTCVIARRGFPDSFAISCRHVLSPGGLIGEEFGAIAQLRGGNRIVAEALLQRGPLSDGGVSCDVQLARVHDVGCCREATGSLALAPLVGENVPQDLWIHSPGGALAVHLDKQLRERDDGMQRDYGEPGRRAIRHETVLCLAFRDDRRTIAGDSGSPVTTAKDGGLLVGMHFAVNFRRNPGDPVDPGDRAFAIPVWELLDPVNYGLSADEKWSLLAPEAIAVPPPKIPRPASALDPHPLGKLSERHETGNRGPGLVSSGVGDPGGPSYGCYQMTSAGGGTVGEFVKAADFPWRDRFVGLVPGSTRFTAVWKDLAREATADFKEAQHDFIKRKFYDVLSASLRAAGLDLDRRSRTLRDVTWSTAVQHGKSTDVLKVAIGACGGIAALLPASRDTDAALIKAVYAERGREGANGRLARFQKSGDSLQAGLRRRFVDELREALDMLAREI